MTISEQIQSLLNDAEKPRTGKYRADEADRDALCFIKGAIMILLRAELERQQARFVKYEPPAEAEPIHMEKNP